MTSLTFYGGVNEVGGNKILLGDSGKRIFLDFGMSFAIAGKYFYEFMQPRKCSGIEDLFEFGMLPDIKGIYRQDYLKQMGRTPMKKSYVDGVFLTHAHMDHCGDVSYLRPEIPIYASTITKTIMEALDKTSSGAGEFIVMSESFKVRPKKRGEGWTRVSGEEAKIPREVRAFEKRAIEIGNISVEPHPVNHSLPGATGYIVHTSKGNIVYTGDFRSHSYGGYLTKEFVEKAHDAKPEILIIEGTRIDGEKGKSEEDVKNEASELVSKTKGLAVVNFPIRDIDRMNSFFEVAKENDRKLVINLKQAYLLQMLEKINVDAPTINDKNIRVYLPQKSWGTIIRQGFPKNIIDGDYDEWERDFLDHKNAVTCLDVRAHQEEYLFRCDFYELRELIDVKPKKGSIYIRSVCEPFTEEMELDMQRVENWLKHFDLMPYHQIHASGHASREELKDVITEINPKVVYPVHTEHPEMFKDLVKGVKVECPEVGREYKI